MIETAAIALPLALGIYLARNHWGTVRGVWQAARWYEKLLLVICLLPWIGPVDEWIGALIVWRVSRRLTRGARR